MRFATSYFVKPNQMIASWTLLCAAHPRRPHVPLPGISVAGPTTDCEWEFEHESQTAAVWQYDGAIGTSFRFSTASTILAQSTRRMCQSGMAQSITPGDRMGQSCSSLSNNSSPRHLAPDPFDTFAILKNAHWGDGTAPVFL